MVRSRRLFLTLPLLLITLAALACGLPGGDTPTAELELPPIEENPPTDTPATDAPANDESTTKGSGLGERPAATLPLSDDFSDPDGIWGNGEKDTGEYEYVDGAYEIRVLPEFQYFYVIAEDVSIPGDDVIIEVDVWKTGGDDETSAGVVCRVDDPSLSFYGFEITFDGWAAILKAVEGEFVIVDQYVETDAVLQGDNAVNHIRAECIGSNLNLYVNGELVHSLPDSELTGGEMGLAAATWPEKPNSTVRFDNLQVTRP